MRETKLSFYKVQRRVQELVERGRVTVHGETTNRSVSLAGKSAAKEAL